MHYARQGVITREMEYVAIRENLGRKQLKEAALRRWSGLGREHARLRHRRNSCATKSRAAAPSSPTTSTTLSPSRWSIGRNFLVKINANIGNSAVASSIGGRGREDGLVDPLGRGHRHGPLDRAATSTTRANGSSRNSPRADRHRADLPGAREGRRRSPKT